MSELTTQAIAYFREHTGYFWQWDAHEEEYVTWAHNGLTICHEQDLMEILRGLSGTHAPPLGTILLIVSACKDNWKDHRNRCFHILDQCYLRAQKNQTSADRVYPLREILTTARAMMDLIHELPAEDRTGKGRAHAIYEIGQTAKSDVPLSTLQEMIKVLEQDGLEAVMEINRTAFSAKFFYKDLLPLSKAFVAFKTEAEFRRQLRHGFNLPPETAEIGQIPETEKRDLLEELSDDMRTAGIAQLTKRLIAAMHIPMHARGA
ncbi:MAG: hypothetical protein AAF570_11710, partial [Bacteroidota bacterium]